ncbi:hypothetical protein [Shinella oryzae]|nr:hypothetical protein [Shinella oryzae]UPA25338.1 hypothetical protein K6301_03800 [Shinella oryzae]
MADTNQKPDEKKGDDVLKRMLKTPPEPKTPPKPKPGKDGGKNEETET